MNFVSIIANYRAAWVVVVLVASLAINYNVVFAGNPVEEFCDFDSARLPEWIKPSHYELLMKLPDLDENSFHGEVTINITIGLLDPKCPPEPSRMRKIMKKAKKVPFGCNRKEIILNTGMTVKIVSATFMNGNNGIILKSKESCRDLTNGFTSIKFDKRLEENSHGQLVVEFTVDGRYNNDEGLYRHVWKNEQTGEEQVSYVTQFEPAKARLAFPCFDEPNLKATFDVILQHPKELTALSNTLPLSQEPVEMSSYTNLIETRFQRTPLMSTYLLAFTVGPYDHLESKIMDEKVLLRVFTPLNEKQKGQFYLDTGRRAYAILHDYFGIEQPLKKIDFLPTNLKGSDAMENWGLITFREDQLLVDSTKTALELAQSAVTISHELAHFWFGNLVTMKWWDNLWLKEAFADWMGLMIANEIYPEYNVNILFVQDLLMGGLEADADAHKTHPIKIANVTTIKEIQASFDRITYRKGASVIRMIESYLGHESFKLGIRDYINKFQYQNTDENDLWNAVQAKTELPVARMMQSWLNQAGFPLVNVELLQDRKVRVRQERFEKEPTTEGQKQLWMIPINMLVVHDDQSELVKFVLSEREQEITLPDWFDATKGHWFKVNAEATGFFRVHYGPKAFAMMKEPIKSKQMSVIDRMNMMDDMRALHSIEKVNLASLDHFLEWFQQEDSAAVIFALTQLVEALRESSEGQSDKHLMLLGYYDKMNNFTIDPNDGVQEAQTREAILLELIRSNHEPTIKEGLRLFDTKGDDDFKSLPELAAVARSGNESQFDKLKQIEKKLGYGRKRARLNSVILVGIDRDRYEQID